MNIDDAKTGTSGAVSPTAIISAAGVSIWLEDLSRERIRTDGLGAPVTEAVFEMTTGEAATACAVLRPVYDATGGLDGRISIEVSPISAHDTTFALDRYRAASTPI